MLPCGSFLGYAPTRQAGAGSRFFTGMAISAAVPKRVYGFSGSMAKAVSRPASRLPPMTAGFTSLRPRRHFRGSGVQMPPQGGRAFLRRMPSPLSLRTGCCASRTVPLHEACQSRLPWDFGVCRFLMHRTLAFSVVDKLQNGEPSVLVRGNLLQWIWTAGRRQEPSAPMMRNWAFMNAISCRLAARRRAGGNGEARRGAGLSACGLADRAVSPVCWDRRLCRRCRNRTAEA